MPAPVAVYAVYSAAADTTALVTPVMVPTPVAGDVLLVKLTTWDTGNPSGASSGGGQAYSTVNTAAPGGFNGYSRIDTCTIVGNPAPFSVTSGGTAAPSRHGMVVEHYLAADGAFLAGSPAINLVKSGGGLPSANITTVGTGSILSWCSVDVLSVDPATRVPLLSATESGLGDFHVGSNSVQYSYYAAVGAPGVYTIGMSSPGGQAWVMTGVEVQFLPPSGGNSITVTQHRRRRLHRRAIIGVGEGAPPPPPTPADVQWCVGTPITGWQTGQPTTGWAAADPGTNWQTLTPEEDCC
jgi:hypothetical protein